MSSMSERPRGRKRKWLSYFKKAVIGFFVIATGLAVSLLIVVAIRQGGARTRVTEMKQAIRRAGLPIDPVSLETYNLVN